MANQTTISKSILLKLSLPDLHYLNTGFATLCNEATTQEASDAAYAIYIATLDEIVRRKPQNSTEALHKLLSVLDIDDNADHSYGRKIALQQAARVLAVAA